MACQQQQQFKFQQMQKQPRQLQSNPQFKQNYKIHYFSSREECSLFFYYSSSHFINRKDKFTLGKIRVYLQKSLFQNQIVSTLHFNSDLDWDQSFFNRLLLRFEGFEIRRKNSGDDSDCTMELIVVDKNGEDADSVLLRVSLVESFGKDTEAEFWKDFAALNKAKSEEIKAKKALNQTLLEKRNKKLEELKEYQEQCENERKVLLGRLSAIFREKTAKLREDFDEQFAITTLDDKLKQATQEGRQISTYQEEKQFMGSLFQPSQDFYRH